MSYVYDPWLNSGEALAGEATADGRAETSANVGDTKGLLRGADSVGAADE